VGRIHPSHGRVAGSIAPGRRVARPGRDGDATVLPESDVGTFAALLAGARLVVANDSGPGHLAAAVGASIVSVFGVTEPEKTRPWGPRVRLVGSGAGWPRYEDVLAATDELLEA
jgi:heptosyltransferase-2